jgi:adenine-specific DNA-methyltransferase
MSHPVPYDWLEAAPSREVRKVAEKISTARPVWEQNGSVYTKPWVVEFILDLAGYVTSENLVDALAVEPCSGGGDFFAAMVRRLVGSCKRQGRDIGECERSLLALDIDSVAVEQTRSRTIKVLVSEGYDWRLAEKLASLWVRRTDFLLDGDLDFLKLGGGAADYVIGNPPYVRLEAIDPELVNLYRDRYPTMKGRADLYVGFYERALDLLSDGGVCAFICADRWLLNQYGASLRKLVTGGYSVEAVVEMHRSDAFHSEVLAYPAITVIRRSRQGRALVAKLDGSEDTEGGEALQELVAAVRDGLEATGHMPALPYTRSVVVDGWFSGADPWPCVSPERLALLKRLEAEFDPLEDEATGTRVGIGVATGADKVFLTKNPSLVEPGRLLRIVMAPDTISGRIKWSSSYLVDPWEADGSLVDLERYPRLRNYLESHRDVLSARHTAKKAPGRWYRTIDKVTHGLTGREKLLIPDIKGEAHPVLDRGEYYPHHNLYYVVSDAWDLRVLGGILLSRLGQFFVECYAVRMSGGYLRFQAQYLRRIRVPKPDRVSAGQAERLRRAFDDRDVDGATAAALEVYGVERIPD